MNQKYNIFWKNKAMGKFDYNIILKNNNIGLPSKCVLAHNNYYVEDIVDKNEQQARIVTPQRKVESFINL